MNMKSDIEWESSNGAEPASLLPLDLQTSLLILMHKLALPTVSFTRLSSYCL